VKSGVAWALGLEFEMRPTRRNRLDTAERRSKVKAPDPGLAQRLRDAQSQTRGAIAGAVAAAASAMVWMIVAIKFNGLYPAITIAMGAACGFAVGSFGRGVEARFGLMAVGFTVLAWISGLALIAYALKAPVSILLSADSPLLHLFSLLLGMLVAYWCTFVWLPKSQKWALSDERGSLAKRD
jgi:hypothetical protein